MALISLGRPVLLAITVNSTQCGSAGRNSEVSRSRGILKTDHDEHTHARSQLGSICTFLHDCRTNVALELRKPQRYVWERADSGHTLAHFDSNSSHQSFDWYCVESHAALTYTSLLGVPIADIPMLGNVSFTVESSYWEVRCGSWSKENSTQITSGPGGQTFALDWHSIKELWRFTSNDKVKFSFDYYTKTSIGGQQNKTSCTATLRLV